MRGVLWEQLFLGSKLSCGQMMWSLQSICNAFQMAAQQARRLGPRPPEPGQSYSESPLWNSITCPSPSAWPLWHDGEASLGVVPAMPR